MAVGRSLSCRTPVPHIARIAFVLLLAGPSGRALADEPPRPAPWVVEQRDVAIPMRDGTSLAANVLLPKTPGRFPAIVVQTPYDKNRMGREIGDAAAGGDAPGNAGRGSQRAWARFNRDAYAYVFVDWRGFFGSKSAMEGVDRRAWRRGLDGYDVVEWVAGEPWCDGKVGTWGGSALGKQQLDTAAEKPPHLVCCVPLIAAMGQRYESYYEGGVLLDAHTQALDRLGFGVRSLVAAARMPSAFAWGVARRRTYAPEKIDVPCLFVSGWWDNDPRGVIETFEDVVARGGERARSESRLMLGPWSHTAIDVKEQGDVSFPGAEDSSSTLTLRFFDHFLRGKRDDEWTTVPRVHAYQTGEDRWITDASWSALTGRAKAWHLLADARIATSPPDDGPAANSERRYTYDPRQPSPTIGGRNLPPLTHGPKDVSSLAKRGDVLAYATAPLEVPIAIRGEVALTLTFSCDRADVDLDARLCDTAPEGAGPPASILVGEAIQRAKLRDGKTAQPLVPGTKYVVTLRFPAHAYTWAKGRRLALFVSSGSSPRYERNPHTGADAWDDATAKNVTVTLFHGRDDAILSLPIVGP